MVHTKRSLFHSVSVLCTLLLAALLIAGCATGGAPDLTPTSGVPITGDTPAVPTTSAPTTGAETPAVDETSAVEETPTAEGTTGAAQPSAPGTVRMAVVRGAMMETMTKLAEQYMQENPGKTVTVEEEPEGGAFDALIAAGNQPDLITVSFGTQIGHLASTGAAIPLEDLPGAQELFARLEPATVQNLYGHNYYIPVGADVTLMIYNKELFTEAGLDPEQPPATWAEFLDAAEKIDALPARSDGSEVHGTLFWNEALAFGGWYWNLLQPMYLNANQNQCQLLNELGTDIVFDQEQCRMADFFDFNQKAQEFAPPTMEKNFFSRSIGMWPQYGYSWEPNLKEAAEEPMVIGEDVGIAPVPVQNEGDTAYSTYGGRAYMIMQTTPERQQNAWDFVNFLMQDETNLVFLQELGYLPTLTGLKGDAYFSDPARQPFVDALQNAVLPEQFEAADKVANAVQGVYQQAAVEGSLQPDEAVTQAAEEARTALQSTQ